MIWWFLQTTRGSKELEENYKLRETLKRHILKRKNYNFITWMIKIIQKSKEVIAVKIWKNGYSWERGSREDCVWKQMGIEYLR